MSRCPADGTAGEGFGADDGLDVVPTSRRPGARGRMVSRLPCGDHPLYRGDLHLLRHSVGDAEAGAYWAVISDALRRGRPSPARTTLEHVGRRRSGFGP